jgi:hypothetical protein
MSVALKEGFAVVPGVFSEREIAALRDAITETIDRVARAMLMPFASSLPSLPIDERLERVAREDRAYASVLLLDRFIAHRARPTCGLHGRWSVVMWVEAGGQGSC